MKKSRLYGIALLTVFSAASCSKTDNADLSGTFTGTEVNMGKGKVHSWVKLDALGDPTAIGFTMNEAALTGLDTGSSMMGNSFESIFPSNLVNTPFQHVSIDWNPHGHEPAGIYDVPHFDFHFYMISSAERMTIPTYDQDSAKFNNAPPASYLPTRYHNFGGGVPMMGAHWVDLDAPELNGKAFTQTFIYGSYDGKVIFEEPMITYDYFKNISEFSREIPRPAKVKISGFYPKRLKISHTNGEYTVSLQDMEYRTGV